MLEGAEAPDNDGEVGEVSEEEFVDLPEGDDGEEELIIDTFNDVILQLAALENLNRGV